MIILKREGDAKKCYPARTKRSSIKSAPKFALRTATNVPLLTDNPGFRPNEGIQREKGDTIVPGEPPSGGANRARILNNFTFFSRERGVFAELDDLAHDGYNLAIEGVGEVLTVRSDEMPEEDEDVDEPILLHLTPIISASIDYEKHNECVASLRCWIGSLMTTSPFYVETRYAWYRLGVPSVEYFPLYVKFYTFHRVAQMAVSSLLLNISATTADLLAGTTNLDHTILGREPNVQDLIEAVGDHFSFRSPDSERP